MTMDPVTCQLNSPGETHQLALYKGHSSVGYCASFTVPKIHGHSASYQLAFSSKLATAVSSLIIMLRKLVLPNSSLHIIFGQTYRYKYYI